MTVFGAFQRAVQQLASPELQRLLAWALGLAGAACIGLAIAVQAVLRRIDVAEIAFLGPAIQVLGGLATIVLVWLMFPAVATFMTGLLVEDVAEATERAAYPDDPPGTAPEFLSGLLSAAWFVVVALAVNLLAIPLYVFLLLVPVLLPVALYGINGYLLGREYCEVAAHRHTDAAAARDLRHANRWRILWAGAGIAFLFTVPVLNLAAPVIGAAAMVHLVKDMAA